MSVDPKARAREVSGTMARFARELSVAENRVAAATARRATAVAAQDRVVASAERVADVVVARMAAQLGPQLTASLTGRSAAAIKAMTRGGDASH
jgi:hypothetical protein